MTRASGSAAVQLALAGLDLPPPVPGRRAASDPDGDVHGEAIEELPLRELTFVVIDLETTGGSARDDAITEIGAVRVRGGVSEGEFSSLVNPGRPIDPYITALTGITNAMVATAPTLRSALAALLEFAGPGTGHGTVWVAHNARFDMGFLRAACERTDMQWPQPHTLCTVDLARRVIPRAEVSSLRLSRLAQYLGAQTTPNHRALDDARATVEVLHALLARVGNRGVETLADARTYRHQGPPEIRAKRSLAAKLPRSPGVYLFRGPGDEVLYVGTAVDLHRRVRSYFTGSDARGRIREMVRLAARVDHIACAHGLEASVRELRLIAAHTPAYNRRSKFPRRGWWICLTDDAFPRLSVRRVDGAGLDSLAIGPVPSRGDALDLADLIAEFTGVRTCTRTIRAGGTHGGPQSPCHLGPDGRVPVGGCRGASDTPLSAIDYRRRVTSAETIFRSDEPAAEQIFTVMCERIDHLVGGHLFETAARLRDRMAALIQAHRRSGRLRALARVPELVAAQPDGSGGWDLAMIRYGRLAAGGRAPRGVPPLPVVESLTVGANTILVEAEALGGAWAEEISIIYRWLLSPGTRIVSCPTGWSEPAFGAGNWVSWQAKAAHAAAAGSRLGT